MEVRMAEAEDKLDRLKLEKAIADMKARVRARRPRRRTRQLRIL